MDLDTFLSELVFIVFGHEYFSLLYLVMLNMRGNELCGEEGRNDSDEEGELLQRELVLLLRGEEESLLLLTIVGDGEVEDEVLQDVVVLDVEVKVYLLWKSLLEVVVLLYGEGYIK
jgi:hypothetical protein